MKKFLFASTSGFPMLRGPSVAFSPDEEGGDNTPEEFREQPGDREPDPDAGDPPPADDPPADDPPGDDPPADDPPADPDPAGDPPAGDGDDPPADPDPDAEPKPAKNWKDRQIIKLRAKEKADSEARAALAAENAELKAKLAGGEEGTILTDAERAKIRQEAVQEVQTKAYFDRINAGCEAMFVDGSKAFPKTWQDRVKFADETFAEEIIARPHFLEAVTDLDNSAAVYHELAGDPDEMERVLNMPAHKMGMELARISARLAAAPAPKPVSRAPAPIKPLDKPGMQERSLEDLSNDPSPAAQREFNRRMDAEEKKRFEGAR